MDIPLNIVFAQYGHRYGWKQQGKVKPAIHINLSFEMFRVREVRFTKKGKTLLITYGNEFPTIIIYKYRKIYLRLHHRRHKSNREYRIDLHSPNAFKRIKNIFNR